MGLVSLRRLVAWQQVLGDTDPVVGLLARHGFGELAASVLAKRLRQLAALSLSDDEAEAYLEILLPGVDKKTLMKAYELVKRTRAAPRH